MPKNRTPGPRMLARARGEKKYDGGSPCVKGHDSPRYVSNACCVACINERLHALHSTAEYKAARNKRERALRVR